MNQKRFIIFKFQKTNTKHQLQQIMNQTNKKVTCVYFIKIFQIVSETGLLPGFLIHFFQILF
jgi:hypothetical protein